MSVDTFGRSDDPHINERAVAVKQLDAIKTILEGASNEEEQFQKVGEYLLKQVLNQDGFFKHIGGFEPKWVSDWRNRDAKELEVQSELQQRGQALQFLKNLPFKKAGASQEEDQAIDSSRTR